MKNYKHILCPIDFSESSEQTLQQALEFKKISNSTITVVNFVEPLSATAYTATAPIDIETDMLRTANKNMDKIRDKYHLEEDDTIVEKKLP